MMGSYGPPVDQLLRIEEDLRYQSEWHDYSAMGIGLEQVSDLARMAVDEDLLQADSDSLEVWGPIHAWRALGQLRAEAAIPTLIGILAEEDEDEFNDWITEELPKVLGMIGPPAIPELTALLDRESASEYTRTDAARSLSEIAKHHPESRDQIVAILTGSLERAEWHDPVLNGFIVSELIDLEAKESAHVIERAYAGQFVDDSICGTWYDVWERLELEGEPPPQTEPVYSIFRDPKTQKAIEFLSQLPRSSGPEPVDRRSPDHRKERNKARQKLEKKVKGKKSKRR